MFEVTRDVHFKNRVANDEQCQRRGIPIKRNVQRIYGFEPVQEDRAGKTDGLAD